MLNWSTPIAPGHPLKRKFPQAYPDQVLPEAAVPGITKVLYEFHDSIADLQRRFLRVIAEGIGCHETFFDEMVDDGPTLTRAIRYPPMAEVARATAPTCGPAEHGDINLITALPRATAPGPAGQGRRRLGRRRRPRRPGDHQHRDHARAAHQRADPDRLAPRRRRARLRGRALQRRAVLPPAAVDDPVAGAELLHAGAPAALRTRSSAADALDEVLYEINLVEDARAGSSLERPSRTTPVAIMAAGDAVSSTSTSRPSSSSRRGSWPRRSWRSTSAARRSRPGW